jgi:hypothetical protein
MILKLILMLFLIIIFYIILVKQIESFSTKNYTNTNEISLEYNKIYSQLPYDIKVKNENSSYYDYGNDELNEKFNRVFKLDYKKQISLIDGITWSKWSGENEIVHKQILEDYYNKILDVFKLGLKNKKFKLQNNDNNFEIVKNTLNRYKIDTNNYDNYLLDVDVLIYRKNKPLARHVKILAVCNNVYVNFLMVKIIGVITECQLYDNLKTNSDTSNFSEFIPEKKILYDMNSFIYDTNERLVHSEIEYNLYNKILKDL